MRNEIVYDMPEKDYRAAEGLSQSDLGKIAESPEHYKYSKDNPTEPSDPMIIGSACHLAILQPELFLHKYVMKDWNNSTKEGKAKQLAADQSGKTILTEKQWETAIGMREKFAIDLDVRERLQGKAEVSMFWEMAGIQCKGRMDFLSESAIIDIKTTDDARPRKFTNSICDFRYYVQAFFYQKGYEILTGIKLPFVIIAIEKSQPFCYKLYTLDIGFMIAGEAEAMRNIETFKACKSKNEYPGYDSEVIETLEKPIWL